MLDTAGVQPSFSQQSLPTPALTSKMVVYIQNCLKWGPCEFCWLITWLPCFSLFFSHDNSGANRSPMARIPKPANRGSRSRGLDTTGMDWQLLVGGKLEKLERHPTLAWESEGFHTLGHMGNFCFWMFLEFLIEMIFQFQMLIKIHRSNCSIFHWKGTPRYPPWK